MFIIVYSICLVDMCFFFFKQKTAYEMRISDWSSDVWSSDLAGALGLAPDQAAAAEALFRTMRRDAIRLGRRLVATEAELDALFASGTADPGRTEESRGGEECVST